MVVQPMPEWSITFGRRSITTDVLPFGFQASALGRQCADSLWVRNGAVADQAGEDDGRSSALDQGPADGPRPVVRGGPLKDVESGTSAVGREATAPSEDRVLGPYDDPRAVGSEELEVRLLIEPALQHRGVGHVHALLGVLIASGDASSPTCRIVGSLKGVACRVSGP